MRDIKEHPSSGKTKIGVDPVKGPQTQHKRLASGEKVDGTHNPNGIGDVSKKSTIAGKHGW